MWQALLQKAQLKFRLQAASRKLIVMEQDVVEVDPMALVLKLREQVQSRR